MDKAKAGEIVAVLQEMYPDARPALEFSSPFELLVAVILSAQCTDIRVNIVTDKLFRTANTPEQFAAMPQDELERYIYSCGFYRSKAEHIISASRDIAEKFGGRVPETIEELQSLAGVGRKTANVVYSVAFGGDAIAVDTHVFRVSNRLGLAHANTPDGVEKQLNEIIDKKLWSRAHHYLIYHGRQVCKSQRPDCGGCRLNKLCEWEDKRA